MDEIYVKVSGQWKYLYRAVDKAGNTADCLLRGALRQGGSTPLLRESHRSERDSRDRTIEEQGESGRPAVHRRRAGNANQGPAGQISQQRAGAGPSGDQTPDQVHHYPDTLPHIISGTFTIEPSVKRLRR